MPVRRIRLGVLLPVALAAAIPAAADTKVDWDHGVDHARFGSFAWREGTPLTNPLAELRIRQAVTALLVERGLTETAEDPDLLVAVHSSLSPDSAMNVGAYAHRSGMWETRAPDLDRIDTGTLVVDLVDPSSGVLVWRGIATGTVTNNPSRNRNKVPRALARMFRRYPPPPPAPEDP